MEQPQATPEQPSPAPGGAASNAPVPRTSASIRQAQRWASRTCRRFPLLPVLAPAALAALLAFALPVAAPDAGEALHNADQFANSATARASEDLAAFRTNQRWGFSLQGEREREEAQRQESARAEAEAANTGAAWSPELQAIGFVGVVIAATERVVLLTLPTDAIGRFHVGDVLQDGRTLASVSTQALVLQREDGEQETLPLFPPAPVATDALVADAHNPPTEGE